MERVKKIRDYAFVHFAQREDAVSAMNALNGKVMHFLFINLSAMFKTFKAFFFFLCVFSISFSTALYVCLFKNYFCHHFTSSGIFNGI